MNRKLLRVLFVLIGALALILGGHYSGPAEIPVHSYGSNVAFSFAAYFLFQLTRLKLFEKRVWVVSAVFIGDTIHEMMQGMGYATGVYDPFDFLANAVGIALALVIDLIVWGTGPLKNPGYKF